MSSRDAMGNRVRSRRPDPGHVPPVREHPTLTVGRTSMAPPSATRREHAGLPPMPRTQPSTTSGRRKGTPGKLERLRPHEKLSPSGLTPGKLERLRPHEKLSPSGLTPAKLEMQRQAPGNPSPAPTFVIPGSSWPLSLFAAVAIPSFPGDEVG